MSFEGKAISSKLNAVSTPEAQILLQAVILDGFLNDKIPVNVCLSGPPGCGKSAIVNDLPRLLAPALGVPASDIVVIDIRLSGMDASDVLGVPYVHEGIMRFSTPEWFPKDDGRYYILFTDELMNCGVNTQQAAYRVLHDRTIQNGAKLPRRCAIVAAGNQKSDKTGAKPLLPAAANRFGMHLNVTNLAGGLNHLVQAGYDPTIVGFLEYRNDAIYTPPTDESAFPTLRTWEAVDRHLKNPRIAGDDFLLTIAVAGAVGSEFATDFMAFREFNGSLPDWKRLRAGDPSYQYKIPQDNEGFKYALGVALAYQFIETLKAGKTDEAENVGSAVLKDLPQEITVVIIRTMKRSSAAIAKIKLVPSLYAAFEKVKDHVR